MTKGFCLIVTLVSAIVFLGLGLSLQMQLRLQQQQEVYAFPVHVNATNSVESDNLPLEEWSRMTDAEYAAFTQGDEIVDLIQTKEGMDFYTNECGYTTEPNPFKILDCYEKNKDKIK
jgi:hypothetical protein